jgi:hypothetical protein
VWALIDGVQPCEAFSSKAVLALLASSPAPGRYKEWKKQKKGEFYFMNAFSWQEMYCLG